VDVSKPQTELRVKGLRMEAAGCYYSKDQADRARSDLSACVFYKRDVSVWTGIGGDVI